MTTRARTDELNRHVLKILQQGEPRAWRISARGGGRDPLIFRMPADRDISGVLSEAGFRGRVTCRLVVAEGTKDDRERLGVPDGTLPRFYVDIPDDGDGGAPEVEAPPPPRLPSTAAGPSAAAARDAAEASRWEVEQLRQSVERAKLQRELAGFARDEPPNGDGQLQLVVEMMRQHQSAAQAMLAEMARREEAAARAAAQREATLLEVLQRSQGSGLLDQFGKFRELVDLARDMVGGGGDSGGGTIAEVARLVRDALTSAPAVAAPPPSPAPPASPRLASPMDLAKRRVTAFVSRLVAEAGAGSDPVGVADAIEGEFLLLPEPVRAAVAEGSTPTIIQAFAQWVPAEVWQRLGAKLTTEPAVAAWVGAVLEALRQDDGEDDDAPGDVA